MTPGEAIADYLKAEFARADVRLLDGPDDKHLGFLVDAQDCQYSLRVEHVFLDKRSADEVRQALAQFSVAEVMRNLQGFSVTLTEYGCIF